MLVYKKNNTLSVLMISGKHPWKLCSLFLWTFYLTALQRVTSNQPNSHNITFRFRWMKIFIIWFSATNQIVLHHPNTPCMYMMNVCVEYDWLWWLDISGTSSHHGGCIVYTTSMFLPRLWVCMWIGNVL